MNWPAFFGILLGIPGAVGVSYLFVKFMLWLDAAPSRVRRRFAYAFWPALLLAVAAAFGRAMR